LKIRMGLGVTSIVLVAGLVGCGGAQQAASSSPAKAKDKTDTTTTTKPDTAKTTDTTPATAPPPATPSVPTWNTKEVDALKNGNIATAIQLINASSANTRTGSVNPAAADVYKDPWNYYGKIVKITGQIAIAQDYPPGSDISNAMGTTTAGEIVLASDDGTFTDYLIAGSSGTAHVGDTVDVYGFPVGLVDAPNKMGGTTSELALVGKDFDVSSGTSP